MQAAELLLTRRYSGFIYHNARQKRMIGTLPWQFSEKPRLEVNSVAAVCGSSFHFGWHCTLVNDTIIPFGKKGRKIRSIKQAPGHPVSRIPETSLISFRLLPLPSRAPSHLALPLPVLVLRFSHQLGATSKLQC